MADQVDYRAKYEKLLRETIKEFQTSVRDAQLRAEENSRGKTTRTNSHGNQTRCCILFLPAVSQQNMSELAEQLRRSEETVQDLQQLLEKTRKRLSATEEQLHQQQREQVPLDEFLTQKRVEFLENLCCLTVEVRRESNKVTYHCTLDDGCLMGL